MNTQNLTTSPFPQNRHIKYLVMDATREGQASHAHVHEIIKGLRALNWTVDLFEPWYAHKEAIPTLFDRIYGLISAQIHFWLGTKSKDLIYIRSHFGAFPTSLLARVLNIPVIQEVNGPLDDLFIAWPWTKYLRSLFKFIAYNQLKWADAIVTVTPQLEKWVHSEIGNCNTFVIPNAANISLFSPNTVENRVTDKEYVIFFGSLTKWQGIDILLNAINDSEWPDDLLLLIVGDGVERLSIEEVAKTNSKLLYIGTRPYKDMAGLISNSIASLIPKNNRGNRKETGLSPLKLYESLACGVPVIVSDFPGQGDFVRKYECGIVISPEDPKALIQAILHLRANDSERLSMGYRGRKIVEEEHSWDKRSKDTEKIFLELIKTRQ